MAGEDQQVRFTVVIDKDTGAVKQVGSDLDDVATKAKNVGEKSKDAAKGGEDGFKKLGGKVTEFASGLLIAQLALEGLKQVAQKNDAFQELQTVFTDTAKSLLETFGPAITKISKGLSGLVTIIGAAAKALVAVAKGEWSQAADIMADSIDRAAGIIDGSVKVITKNMREAAATQLAQQEAHNQAMLQLQIADADGRLQALNLTEDQKLALIAEKKQVELEALERSQEIQRQQIELQHQTDQITEQQYQAQLTALKQKGADARKAVALKSRLDEEAIAREHQQKLESFFKQEIQAGAAAGVARYNQTKNVGDAVRAAAGAEVDGLADYAAEFIAIQGAKSAAAAFTNAITTTPGPAGFAAGVAAAGATLAFYTGLAAIVGVAGHAIGGAIAGGDGGGATGGGGGSGGNGGSSSSAGDFSSSPLGAPSSTPGGVAAPGQAPGTGGVTVLVYLDGDVLFRAITNASRDGRVVITSRNVVP